jgi:protein required for attachment to host cells
MAGLRIDRGEWVVVADGARALILENVGDPFQPDLRTREVYRQDNPKTHELGADQPGRAFNSVDGRRSAMEQTDWHKLEERRFLARLAERLDRAVQSGETRSLVLVAPPTSVGVLREEFSKHVRNALRAQIEKDYVKMPVDEIARHLAA